MPSLELFGMSPATSDCLQWSFLRPLANCLVSVQALGHPDNVLEVLLLEAGLRLRLSGTGRDE